MRKFKFFALAFAALSFAACSDDAIEDSGQGQNNGGNGAPAYLTVTFTANSGNSTRADNEDSNNGDSDGNAEDSGHENAGTADEVAVKRALVLVAPTDNNGAGFAKLYTVGTGGNLTEDADDETEEDQPEDFVIVDNNSKTYRSGDPIRVSEGTYNVLVVINPVSTLSDRLDNMQLTSGSAVKALYEDIITGKYVTDDGLVAPDDAAEGNTYVDDMGNGTDGFMMANKEVVEVTLTSDNTPDNPQSATVNVERVISKVTFRATTPAQGGENIYPVEVNSGQYTAITEEGLIVESTEPTVTYEYQIFNETHDKNVQNGEPAPKVVYALFKETGTEGQTSLDFVGGYRMTGQDVLVDVTNNNGVYSVTVVDDESTGPVSGAERKRLYVFVRMTPQTQTQYNALTDPDEISNAYVVADADISNPENSLELQFRATTTSTWYVQLVGYSLVNLSKEVNYVRHITNSEGESAFGTLDGANFLYTPYFDAKNDIVFDPVTNAFPASTPTDTWYYNTLVDVAEESDVLTIDNSGALMNGSNPATYFKLLTTLGADGGNVTGGGEQHTDDNLQGVGKLMSYIYENSTDITHQVHGLSTGISFVARMYKKYENETLSEPVEELYLYSDRVYESLEDIAEAYGVNTPQDIKDLIEKGDGVTDSDLENANVEKYNDNMCYYYTSRIKHYDNNRDSELGNMEFAIMRNNIYSIAVSNIVNLGTPSVDPTPGVPNESSEAAIEITTNIVPWIVRYNDIEF